MESVGQAFQAGVDGLNEDLAAALSTGLGSLLDASTRLCRLDAEGEIAGLHVEAVVLEEALSQPWRLEVVVLHEWVDLDLDAMLAHPVTVVTVLADGSEHRRSGLVLQAQAGDSDGGFARCRIVVQPWFGFLARTLRSRVWQEQNFTASIEPTLGAYSAYGSWRWSPCVGQLLAGAADGGVRSYCVQYRESDLDFVSRLLADEGIGYRFEEAGDGSPGSAVVFFATPPQPTVVRRTSPPRALRAESPSASTVMACRRNRTRTRPSACARPCPR